MQDLINNVYSHLKGNTAALAKKIADYKELEALDKSGIYTVEYLNKNVRPKMYALKREIEQDKAAAISGAYAFVEDYKANLRELDELHPEEMTEDVKLFNAGVKLTARDINAILARNEGNGTMEQITLRYAKEHKIDIGKRYYIGHQQEIQQAEGVGSAIHYYEKWIDTDKAGQILDRFFGVENGGE